MWLGWGPDHLKPVWSLPQKTLFSVTYLFCWASAFAERFFYAGSVPQADLQTFKVSVTAVKSVQRKRTGEKESCVSHMNIWGCFEGELKGCCVLERGQTVLAGPRGAFCWILLFHQGKIHLNFRNLGVPETTSPPVCLGLCGHFTKNLFTPPNALLLLPGLPPLKFWASPKTRSPILRIYY